MENRYIQRHLKQLWNKKITPIVISVLFVAMAGSIAYLSTVITDLTADNENLSTELDKTRPYIQLSKDQAAYIKELEEKVHTLEDSTAELETNLSNLESELSTLESNLNVLGDIKDKTK